MYNSSEPSHVNHVAVAVLVFILGSLVGYYVGAAYESEAQSQTQYDQNYFFGLKKKTAKTTPSTTSTTTDKTADWKTYTNTKYGYSFKYPLTNQAPEDEGIAGTKAADSQILHIYLTNDTKQSHDLTMIRFTAATLSTTDQNLTLVDYVKSISKQDYTMSNEKIGDQPVVKVNYTTGSYTIKDESGQVVVSGAGSDVRFIKHNNSIYMVEPNANGTNTGNAMLADQVLSTFKFIE